MQLVRSTFGAQNVAVENPAWMSGGWQLLPNLTLPFNRLIIIAFAFAVLVGVAYLIARTRLGLFVRGVTQNRPIAAVHGREHGARGHAGVCPGQRHCRPGRLRARARWQRRPGPGPELHRATPSWWWCWAAWASSAGTVYAALGLGILNKFLEGWTGAVLAKIAVLVFIIAFIQKQPQGIFAMKGRSAEA